MPGSEQAQVEQAFRLADRVSINLEGANTERLAALAPQKHLRGELLPAMQWVNDLTQARPFAVKIPSMVTQFVVGPAGESDRELLTGADWLYRRVGLARAYYSPFRPVTDTPLWGQPATPAIREFRLYQADFLLRDYGFGIDELPFAPNNALPEQVDPKLAWARQHLTARLIEINRADRSELLRVPGIGPKGVDAILQARHSGRLQSLTELKALGVIVNRAAPFILLNGRRPPHQLALPLSDMVENNIELAEPVDPRARLESDLARARGGIA
jgi:predicted DNA-binding helix-hairpin-helix protein